MMLSTSFICPHGQEAIFLEMHEMTPYQTWEHGVLEDIGKDVDTIIKMVGGEEKMESYDSGLIAGLLSKQGIDPGILAMLNNNKDGMLGDNGLVLLFLILLLGGNGGFFGNRGAPGDVAEADRDYRATVNAAYVKAKSGP